MDRETNTMPVNQQEQEPTASPLTEEEMVQRLRQLIVELEEQRNAMFTKNRLLRAIEKVSWRFWRGEAAPTAEGRELKNGSAALPAANVKP